MATSDIKKGPLYVDSTNNRVGVGTSSPATPLHISGAAAAQNYATRITNTATDGYSTLQLFDDQAGIYRAGSGVSAYGGASSLNILTVGAHPVTLGTSNTVRMTVAGNGNVGIGTSSPSAKLDIRPSNEATNTFRIYRGVDSGYQLDYLNISQYTGDSVFNSVSSGGANNEFIFQQNATERMRIDNSGRVTMPYQPAWHLQPSWTSNTTPSSNSIIPFGVYGGHGTFATSVTVSSGRVTVPVSGKYWIASTMRQENSQTDYQISLRKNGAQYIRSGIWYSSQAYENIHLMGMVNLAANDYLEIDISSSNMPPINGNTDTLTFFSGYLVG